MSKNKCSRLKDFSISFFAIVLGLIGLTLALQKAENIFSFSFSVFSYFLYFTLIIFLSILTIYGLKIVKYPSEVKKEFFHPIKINFFPIIAKIFLILSIIFLDINMVFSRNFWFLGTALQFIFSIVILSIWIRHSKFEAKHLSPAWFIPIVGNIIMPIAGTAHGFVELSWFFFSIGLVMWLTLFIIVFNRIIFHDPIPDKLIPTFFILFAPPAIAFIAYIKLTGSLDSFARILYYIALFLLILILTQVKMFSRIQFYLSWWAYSFPLAAITIATMLMYHQTEFLFFGVLSQALLALLLIIIFYLVYRTVRAIKNKELCVEEG
ncbi:MAG: SLAC1 anion channel family protein [Patescibacteria group bacterium]|nr:SLAC1 anion channel family protein [Patescibacteria group bacterium]